MPAPFIAVAAASYAVSAGLNYAFSPILDTEQKKNTIVWQRNEVRNRRLSWPLELSEYITGIISGHYATADAQFGISGLGYITYATAYDDKFFSVTKREEAGADSVLKQKWAYVGLKPDNFAGIDAVIWRNQATLGVSEILELMNRNNLDPELANEQMMRNGYRDKGLIEAIYSLRNNIPPITDAIRFAVRDVFSADVSAKFGYHREFPFPIEQIARWHGLGWETGFKTQGVTDDASKTPYDIPITWPMAYWMAHWDLPSPSQGFEMLHRLYTESPFGPSPFLKSVKVPEGQSLEFTTEDMNVLLKANDYPEYWRGRLTAIAYSTLTLTDMKRMYRLGSLDEAGVYHALRAYGYSPEDAPKVLDYIRKLERPQLKASIGRALKQGIIDEAKATQMLTESGLSERESRHWVTNYLLDKAAADVSRMVRYVRKGMLDGLLSEAGARSALSSIGIVSTAIAQYITEWNAMVQYTRRFPTLAKFIAWGVAGIMTPQELQKRLTNLRYVPEDISRILAEVNMQRESKAQAAAARARKAK